ncbi:MAG: hypothetical protein LUE26_09075 [Alistipes sp.]|nr:hypothetical protein [Alistipes sp.]
MREIRKFLLMLFVVAMPVALVSGCSDSDDDEEEEEEVTLAEKIEGIYYGSISAVLFDEEVEADIAVTVVRTTDTSVSLDFGKVGTRDGGTISIPVVTGVDLTGVTASVGIVKDIDTTLTYEPEEGEPTPLEVSLVLTGSIKAGTEMRFTIILDSDEELLAEVAPLELTVEAEQEEDDEEDE